MKTAKRLIFVFLIIVFVVAGSIIWVQFKSDKTEIVENNLLYEPEKIVTIMVFDTKVTLQEAFGQNAKLHLSKSLPKDEVIGIIRRATVAENANLSTNRKTMFILKEDANDSSIYIDKETLYFTAKNKVYKVRETDLAKWTEFVMDMDFKVDTTGFKDFDETIEPIENVGGVNGHTAFSFGEEDVFIICAGADFRISPKLFYNFALEKYEKNVKLSKYYHDDNVLKLLYEDGSYICWNTKLICVTDVKN